MIRALEFLQESGTFYLATVEEDQPRVRPFGATFEYEGKLCTVTNNKKKCYEQMIDNPKVEISGMSKDGRWIRLTGEVSVDNRREVKQHALDAIPFLKSMYSIDDGIFSVLYFTKATATISSFNAEAVTFSF